MINEKNESVNLFKDMLDDYFIYGTINDKQLIQLLECIYDFNFDEEKYKALEVEPIVEARWNGLRHSYAKSKSNKKYYEKKAESEETAYESPKPILPKPIIERRSMVNIEESKRKLICDFLDENQQYLLNNYAQINASVTNGNPKMRNFMGENGITNDEFDHVYQLKRFELNNNK